MKIHFNNRLEAIEWIANHAEDEGQFEVLREQLNFNHIYHGHFFLDTNEPVGEVILLDQNKRR